MANSILPIYNGFKTIISSLALGIEPTIPTFELDNLGKLMHSAWLEQGQIGWSQILKGRISTKWGEAQQAYYSSHPNLAEKKSCDQTTWSIRTI